MSDEDALFNEAVKILLRIERKEKGLSSTEALRLDQLYELASRLPEAADLIGRINKNFSGHKEASEKISKQVRDFFLKDDDENLTPDNFDMLSTRFQQARYQDVRAYEIHDRKFKESTQYLDSDHSDQNEIIYELRDFCDGIRNRFLEEHIENEERGSSETEHGKNVGVIPFKGTFQVFEKISKKILNKTKNDHKEFLNTAFILSTAIPKGISESVQRKAKECIRDGILEHAPDSTVFEALKGSHVTDIITPDQISNLQNRLNQCEDVSSYMRGLKSIIPRDQTLNTVGNPPALPGDSRSLTYPAT